VELLDLDPSQRTELSPRTQDIVRQLNYGTHRGDDHGLSSDLSNSGKPGSTGRESVVRLVKFMRARGMSIPDFVEYLRQKWEPK
jgi:hypothetical protein